MAKARPKVSDRSRAIPVSPINFRMPIELRTRLRSFAKRRYLGEAEALRLILAEFLDEDESQRELIEAERWQFKQAYTTWQRHLRGKGRTVAAEEIQKIFADAQAGRLSRPAE